MLNKMWWINCEKYKFKYGQSLNLWTQVYIEGNANHQNFQKHENRAVNMLYYLIYDMIICMELKIAYALLSCFWKFWWFALPSMYTCVHRFKDCPYLNLYFSQFIHHILFNVSANQSLYQKSFLSMSHSLHTAYAHHFEFKLCLHF